MSASRTSYQAPRLVRFASGQDALAHYSARLTPERTAELADFLREGSFGEDDEHRVRKRGA